MKNLLLRTIATIFLLMPHTARSEVETDPPEARVELPRAPPPVSRFRIPEKLSFCGDQVPLERPDVKERLEREFYHLLDRQGLMVTYIKRAARCNPIVEVILEMEEMPEDLK